MLTDLEIERALTEPVRRIPYPGTWLRPPFDGDGWAVAARDSGISELRVDRATGRVGLVLVGGASVGGPHAEELIAPSLTALVALAEAYDLALRAAQGASEVGLPRAEETLLAAVRAVAPALAPPGAEEGFWVGAAEEIGLGTTGGEASAPVTVPGPAGPTVVVATPMGALAQALRAEGMGLTDLRALVSYSACPGTVAEGLASTAAPGAFRTGPAQVLVLAHGPAPTAADLRFEGLRLVVGLGRGLPDGVVAPDGVEVVRIDDPSPYSALARLVRDRSRDGRFTWR